MEAQQTLEGPPGCWFCHDEVRTDPPPLGWLYDDGVWRAGHAPVGYSVAGTVVVEAHRHVLDQAEMTAAERRTLNDVLAQVIAAIKQATRCDRVYQWATMDAFAHYHLWLIPWWESSPTRGPRYLMSAIGTGGADTSEAAVKSAVRAIRDALAPAPVASGASRNSA